MCQFILHFLTLITFLNFIISSNEMQEHYLLNNSCKISSNIICYQLKTFKALTNLFMVAHGLHALGRIEDAVVCARLFAILRYGTARHCNRRRENRQSDKS